jgi:hypothetical protein
VFLFFGNIGVGENGINWTFWDARTTINAFIWVDNEVCIGFSKRLNRANDYAFLVFVIDAG